MSVILAEPASELDHVLEVDGDVADATLGGLMVIDEEVVKLDAFEPGDGPRLPRRLSPHRWRVTRGMYRSAASAHSAGAEIRAARPGVLLGEGLEPPSPVIPESGGGPHDHDADYSALGHDHDSDYEATGAVAAHAAAADPHPGYLTAAEGAGAFSPLGHGHVHDHDGTYAPEAHSHPSGEAYKVGDLYFTKVNHANAAAVAAHHGYGTWARWGVGRFLLLTDSEADVEAGSATHSHGFDQPTDHPALAHAGATVGDHAALSHSAHAGATVGNHAFTQPNAHSDHGALSHSAHAGAAVADHGAHTHTFTAGSTSATPDLVTSNTAGSGVAPAGTTGNPSATLTHAVTQPSAHSDHAAQSHSAHAGGAVDAHTVGQASAHSDHAIQAHTVGQASQHGAQAHAGGAVQDGSTAPLSITGFAWERTA